VSCGTRFATALLGCLGIASAAFSQNSTPPAATQSVLPVDYFMRFDEIGQLKLSPNGEFVAGEAGKGGQYSLLVIALKDKKVVGGVRMPDRMTVADFHWVSDERLIYMTGERSPGERFPRSTGDIYGMNRDGKGQAQLYGYWGQQQTGSRVKVRESSVADPMLISTLRGDGTYVLLAEYPWKLSGNTYRSDADAQPTFSKLDVRKGTRSRMGSAPLGRARILVDNHDQVRFAVGRNQDQHLAVVWRAAPGDNWSSFALPGFDSETVKPRRFSKDDRSVYFTAQREGESFVALYRLDLANQQVSKAAGFDNSDVRGIITDFADREIVGVYGSADRPQLQWLEPNDPVARLHQSLLKAFADQYVEVVSTTQDGHLALVFVSSDVNPGEYYLFDTVKRNATFFQASRAWIDPRRMRPKEPITVTARDGLVLHGYLTRPAGAGEHPMVVMPHGGPYGVHDDGSFDGEVQLLANRGYAVLQINFRGSGGYGARFEEAGYREWGGRMQDDVTDATKWAIDQKVAPADRICIFGGSYGAYAALMGAAKEPKLYRCAIGLAGVYDLELMMSSADVPRSRSGRAYLADVLGTDVEQLHARSPVYNAKAIEIPVMLVHGEADPRADFEHATRMKAALDKYGKTVEWLALAGEGHGIYDEESRRMVYERVLAFLDRNLMQKDTAQAH
jgi:dienelactone hydrolase